MNTRNKIVAREDLASFLSGAPAILVIGSFDPMLAPLAARLVELSRPDEFKLVTAVSCDPNGTVLSLGARLEMTAALAVVDFVLPYEFGLETAFPWTAIYDETALHARWSAEFKQHVRRRSLPATA